MLLNRANFSAKPLKTALIRLHDLDPDVMLDPNKKIEGLRDYPSLNERLKAINPRLVYVHAAGYGADGPYAQRPIYAGVASALAGQVVRQFLE